MKPIITTPNQVLTTRAKPVPKINHKTIQVITEMRDALIKQDQPKGVGLAAPQIGISWRIFLIRPQETDPIRVFLNPQIIVKSKKMVDGIPDADHRLEGCLSIPQVWGSVRRHESVTIKYLDEKGDEITEKFSGFPAVIIQHELDHLDGILFTRRVIEQKGKLYKPGVDDDGKEILEPLEI
ncbi:MAG: Peptide deformylase [Candidatus Gottesmanbacteria bacterium GW2011_GWB1_43_11]|uniref:Peptide deformylase n=1 Tax=Candidatus Gottesmanbacteria bacterium GW2011_GWB1_43_11 TaxID=1618446 RepID=A0A0G1EW26_9BACT|nr:MAG: Peptide deformylase [Candidatus Gottesmanbacteria bacterium GW2011_GWA2_42_16]KKS54598.1 MAG: Peptide deformylase [Candidatus Gottesmanbacteria bacterium GW2011_GWA1_42_26]KKS82498.1 MAG: Peptide deformylase [Candidatus Gottesmanbacteria bacterium GW2011_GWC1_43_10]KKS87221.1 MAG: Peptide deformylase [Candidatus Gottesmanbacteria bacterium GW2011_GWB1_43_11]OGG07588.1 MAG: peptide deformylase [Candidatus Gottesmanbacteria bacterium RIFCSPHIGHO2_01_FULL_43_15]HCM37934.1 peptide deformyl